MASLTELYNKRINKEVYYLYHKTLNVYIPSYSNINNLPYEIVYKINLRIMKFDKEGHSNGYDIYETNSSIAKELGISIDVFRSMIKKYGGWEHIKIYGRCFTSVRNVNLLIEHLYLIANPKRRKEEGYVN